MVAILAAMAILCSGLICIYTTLNNISDGSRLETPAPVEQQTSSSFCKLIKSPTSQQLLHLDHLSHLQLGLPVLLVLLLATAIVVYSSSPPFVSSLPSTRLYSHYCSYLE